MSKYLSVKYLQISKKGHPKLEPLKKLIFWGPALGGFRGSCPKKSREKKLRLQLNNFTQQLNFVVLWFRRAYKN